MRIDPHTGYLILETAKRADSLQINAAVHPEEAIPTEARHRISADKYREHPEAWTTIRPNIGVAKQTAGYGSWIYRK